ncbi:phosphoesterase [Aspergillus luchuensis]|uniref:Phosphoesterase n=1 Tax=Aspergillus kawachii TaxID=1069201 RepID=A0A146F194_ASPKA|nr:phosphoesterase [Aspergillus luchuensis]
MLADLQEAAEFPLITRRMLAKQSRIEHPWSSWNMVDSNDSLFLETVIVQATFAHTLPARVFPSSQLRVVKAQVEVEVEISGKPQSGRAAAVTGGCGTEIRRVRIRRPLGLGEPDERVPDPDTDGDFGEIKKASESCRSRAWGACRQPTPGYPQPGTFSPALETMGPLSVIRTHQTRKLDGVSVASRGN